MSAESHHPPVDAISPQITADALNSWSQRIDQLNLEVEMGDLQQEFPDWWYENYAEMRDIQQSLARDDSKPSDISKWFELYEKEARVYTKLTGRAKDGLIGQAIYDLGPHVIAKGFLSESEDGPIHTALSDSLVKIASESFGVATAELQTLQQAYGLETITKLLGVKGGQYESKIRSLLLEPRIVSWIRYNDQPRKDDETWKETQAASRQWLSGALEAATGISHDEAMNYAFSASRLGEDDSLGDLVNKFDHFGVARIRRITEATGIVGLDAYSVEQLERMDRFASNPEGFAASLKDHDVSVMLVNRVGDYSGVMSSAAAEFDDTDNERMLFFEIASVSDILRHMVTLRKHGIKPSTLVLSAHSAPGRFGVSDERMKDAPRQDVLVIAGRKLVAMANISPDLEKGFKGYSMHGMKGIARVVEDYMAPSKGVDDYSGDLGRKKIIFQACHAGTEVEYRDVDDNGNKVPMGTDSVISRLGEDLVASGVTSNVDIYGAPAGIQMHRTANGVRYSGQAVDFGYERTPLHAIRIRIEGGNLSKSDVDEIQLRQQAG